MGKSNGEYLTNTEWYGGRSMINQEIHRLYKECEKVFEPSLSIERAIGDIEDEDEKEFFVMVSEFFLQKKQKALLENGDV